MSRFGSMLFIYPGSDIHLDIIISACIRIHIWFRKNNLKKQKKYFKIQNITKINFFYKIYEYDYAYNIRKFKYNIIRQILCIYINILNIIIIKIKNIIYLKTQI